MQAVCLQIGDIMLTILIKLIHTLWVRITHCAASFCLRSSEKASFTVGTFFAVRL